MFRESTMQNSGTERNFFSARSLPNVKPRIFGTKLTSDDTSPPNNKHNPKWTHQKVFSFNKYRSRAFFRNFITAFNKLLSARGSVDFEALEKIPLNNQEKYIYFAFVESACKRK